MDRKRKLVIIFMLLLVIPCLLLSSKYVLRVHSANSVETDETEENIDVTMYELSYPEPDGNHGFYRTKPKVTIVNQDEQAITKYRVKAGDEIIKEESIVGQGTSATIEANMFGEGITTIEVWMEQLVLSENQEEKMEIVEKSYQTLSFSIDTKSPELKMSAPSGFECWYVEDVMVHVTAVDDGIAGLNHVKAFVNGNEKCKKEFTQSEGTRDYQDDVTITESSTEGKPITITMEASDLAGNISRLERKLWIDRIPPQITWGGISNYAISAKSVNLLCEIYEENMVLNHLVHVQYCDTENQTTEWNESGNTSILLSKDGLYEITATAMDQAGHQSTEIIHLTIDQQSPTIRYVNQLDGSYLPYFEWNYKSEDCVSDYLSYDYHMKVDQILYQTGERIEREGIHTFCLEAVDAAGNKSETNANFIIDHTAPAILFENAENGASYTNAIDLNITTEDKEDQIQKVEINGQKQQINSSSQFFQFPFQEPGEYEVDVIAVDLAGNKSEKKIQFEVKEKLKDTILKPIKTIFHKMEVPKKNEDYKMNVAKTTQQASNLMWKLILVILLGVVIVGIGIGIVWKRYKNKK